MAMTIVGIIAATLLAVAVLAIPATFVVLAYAMIADHSGFRSGWRYSDTGEFILAGIFLILALATTALFVLPYMFNGGFEAVVGWFA